MAEFFLLSKAAVAVSFGARRSSFLAARGYVRETVLF